MIIEKQTGSIPWRAKDFDEWILTEGLITNVFNFKGRYEMKNLYHLKIFMKCERIKKFFKAHTIQRQTTTTTKRQNKTYTFAKKARSSEANQMG